MIHLQYNNEVGYREVSFKRMTPNVVRVRGTGEPNTSGFKTFSSMGEPLGDFSDYTTVYKSDNAEVFYSNDGSVYVEEVHVQRELTPEEIKQMLIDGIQNWMDEVAMSRGYDGILSACSYIDTGIERFDKEGEASRKWRSLVWAYCYAYLDEVLEGKRSIPTLEELIAELPKIEWEE